MIFLLPGRGTVPVGGFKVVFEYANKLAADGISVELVYPRINDHRRFDLVRTLLYGLNFFYKHLTRQYKTRWFPLDRRIRERWVWRLDACRLDKKAAVVATAIETAFSLHRNKRAKKGENLFYLIQDFENWAYTDAQVIESYHLPMKKFVISRWLQKIVEDCGEKAVYVPNGFDAEAFRLSMPVEERTAQHLVCLYHEDPRKDLPTLFAALQRVREHIPTLQVSFFGVYPPPALPPGCTYHRCPERALLNQLYNSAAIYVGASKVEGWGLTLGEAMLCGCAVACTDNRGYLEMARQGETALISPVGDADALAANVCRLIEDDALRHRIAHAGHRFIQSFDPQRSYEQLKTCLQGYL